MPVGGAVQPMRLTAPARVSIRADVCLIPLLALIVLTTGCAGPRSAPPPAERAGVQSAPHPYNLSGYSTAFKEGYADACATPRRRNAERFKTDGEYSMGWNDGQSVCRSR